MARILSIVECSYRGTLEEQDDTILWFNHAIKNAGADVTLLLRSSSVNYIVKNQRANGLMFGYRKQKHAPEIDKDLEKIVAKGIPVYCIQEDFLEQGLAEAETISGIQMINRENLPAFFETFDHIWDW